MKKLILSGEVGSIRTEQVYSAKRNAHTNTVSRFFKWCESQEENKFLWLALSFFGLIGMMLPVTALAILFGGGNNQLFWIIACAVNVPVLILNLAAQPLRTILPALCLALLTDAIIIVTCIVMFMIY
jgi:hypothetical protein